MSKLTKKQREHVKTLAIAYAEVTAAVAENKRPGVKACWARMLMEAQINTGVELITPSTLIGLTANYKPDRSFYGVEIYS